jgi:arsenate reductase
VPSVTIYHNPRCSKSRQTLDLLIEHGIEPEIILYLDEPPTPTQLKKLLSLLKMDAKSFIRKKEPEFKKYKLDAPNITEKALIDAMCKHPKLIERPIVVYKNQARLGRPPEQVLEILP